MYLKVGIIFVLMFKFYKNKGVDKIKVINIRELIEIYFFLLRLLMILSLVLKFIMVFCYLVFFIVFDY